MFHAVSKCFCAFSWPSLHLKSSLSHLPMLSVSEYLLNVPRLAQILLHKGFPDFYFFPFPERLSYFFFWIAFSYFLDTDLYHRTLLFWFTCIFLFSSCWSKTPEGGWFILITVFVPDVCRVPCILRNVCWMNTQNYQKALPSVSVDTITRSIWGL